MHLQQDLEQKLMMQKSVKFFDCKSLDSWETSQERRMLFFLRNSFLLWCEVLFNVIVLLRLTSAPNFVIWFLGTHFTLLLTAEVTAFGCCWQVLNFKPQNGCPPVSNAKFPHPNLAKLKALSTGSLLFVWWLCKWPFATWCFSANNVVETPNMSIVGPKTHAVKGWTEWDIWYTSSEWVKPDGTFVKFTSSEWKKMDVTFDLHPVSECIKWMGHLIHIQWMNGLDGKFGYTSSKLGMDWMGHFTQHPTPSN